MLDSFEKIKFRILNVKTAETGAKAVPSYDEPAPLDARYCASAPGKRTCHLRRNALAG